MRVREANTMIGTYDEYLMRYFFETTIEYVNDIYHDKRESILHRMYPDMEEDIAIKLKAIDEGMRITPVRTEKDEEMEHYLEDEGGDVI